MARVGVSAVFDGAEEADDIEAGSIAASHRGVLSGRDARRVFGLLGCRGSERKSEQAEDFRFQGFRQPNL